MLLAGKTVPNDVMDMFVVAVIESLKRKPHPYKKRAKCPLALLMSKTEHLAEVSQTMMEDDVFSYHVVELLLCPSSLMTNSI